MKSILLEGTELSGKTSLVIAVKKVLQESGKTVYVNDGPIDKQSRHIKRFLAYAKEIKSPSLRELMYTLSLMADALSPNTLQAYYGIDYFLQERGFPSVIAFSKVFNKFGINRYLGNYLSFMYPHFDVNIHVKTSQDERRRRISIRQKPTSLDRLVISSPEAILMLEEEIQKVLKKENSYFEIDTSKMSIEEATAEIIARLRS